MRVRRVAWLGLGLVAWPIQYASEFLRALVVGIDDFERLRPWLLDRIRN